MDELLKELASWIRDFGHGAAGFAVLAMILLAWIVPKCLPQMWKALLDYRVAMKEIEPKTRELDVQVLARLERMGGKTFRVEPERRKGKKKELRP